jgi:8-oxo-dGTP pyrophosphatase MutT (NUDIX family)
MGIPTVSAGGILFRQKENDILIIIVEWEKGVPEKWAPILRQLPKGGCRPGETLEQTALREVLEETGFRGHIIRKAGEAKWSYERDGQVWDETVHYYFMEPLTLVAQRHDDEFDFVRWIRIEEAAQILSYPEERELLSGIIAEGKIPI